MTMTDLHWELATVMAEHQNLAHELEAENAGVAPSDYVDDPGYPFGSLASYPYCAIDLYDDLEDWAVTPQTLDGWKRLTKLLRDLQGVA
jgi:hypothetical protein